jgi:hypothetical protein
MRNLTPSSLTALPAALHRLADYEQAFNARRMALRHETNAALVVARATVPPQPTMSWVDGPRAQPRDGRGRFLPRTWLADAELFLPSDLAWFRSPIGAL